MSGLNFDFEKKLLDFIEKNYNCNFKVEIIKDASGVHIQNAIDKAAIYKELETIDYVLIDMAEYDRDIEQIDLEDNITLACDNIIDLLEGE